MICAVVCEPPTQERKMDDHPSSTTVSAVRSALAEVFADTEAPAIGGVNWSVV